MLIHNLICTSCGFSPGTFTVEGGLYVMDDEGCFIRCRHPLEHRTIAEVLGQDADIALVRERTERLYEWLCLDCLSEGAQPRGGSSPLCSRCGSRYGKFFADIDGHPCPACKSGRMMVTDTGLVV
ncbi:MAG: hypothetical protein RI826_09735 [Chlorobium phaeovibrioides]|nr:hypothetical protein [Chlorobium phaeovibrioides]